MEINVEKRILEITFYEDNDRELKDNKYWINKSNVNVFINDELVRIFDSSIYENENFDLCMQFLNKEFPNRQLVNKGCRSNGWDYMIFEI